MDELKKDLHTLVLYLPSLPINTSNLANSSLFSSLRSHLKDQQPPSRDGGWVRLDHYQGGSVSGGHICQCRY